MKYPPVFQVHLWEDIFSRDYDESSTQQGQQSRAQPFRSIQYIYIYIYIYMCVYEICFVVPGAFLGGDVQPRLPMGPLPIDIHI